MNIVIVGPGAIGSLWAYSFYKAGHSVSVSSRKTTAQISIDLDHRGPVTFGNNSIQLISSADMLLVTAKAPQVLDALSPLITHIHHDCMIVLMHNGMGTAQSVSKLIPHNPLLFATTTHGAYRQNSEQVKHTGEGITHIGGLNEKGKQCQFLADVFNHALPATQWSEDIITALWNKLAINCAINPLTAIKNVKNGQLALAKYQPMIDDIVQETVSVMHAEHIEVSYQQIREKVDTVIKATAKNNSSMQQDIFHQRQSEIDFITGYLIKCAHQHGIELTTNRQLYNQIKQIEQNWKSS